MKRGPVSRFSERRLVAASDRAGVRRAVLAREGGCRARGESPCFGRLTVHHIRKASQGGSYEPDNLVALCACHNDLIESDADFARRARAAGWTRLSWEEGPEGEEPK